MFHFFVCVLILTHFLHILSSSPQITKQQLQQTKDRFQAFLNGDTQIVADEAFINAVQSYSEVWISQHTTQTMHIFKHF